MKNFALLILSLTSPWISSLSAADSPRPTYLHCTGAVCTEGMPKCASESYGSSMTIRSMDTGKPSLVYDGLPDAPTQSGSVRDSFLIFELRTVRVKFPSISAEFDFKRAEFEQLTEGHPGTIKGVYKRQPGAFPHGALLQVSCTTELQAPPSPPASQPIEALRASCASCHGDNGVSAVPGVPNIGGQKLATLVNTMNDYRIGARNDVAMSAMNAIAQGLNAADTQAIAAYYAGLPRPAQTGGASPNHPSPSVRNCCACHSKGGILSGNGYGDVFLTSQSPDYLTQQLKGYTNGVGSDFLMRYIVNQYSADELASFVGYFASSTEETVCTDLEPPTR